MKLINRTAAVMAAISFALCTVSAVQAETLRLLTWGNYAPDEVIQKFKEETGIDVEVTTSNNEEMISKLRATGGAGFDLAQPSQDRITGPQLEYGIYKPMDVSKIDASLWDATLLESSKKNTTVNGEIYGVAHTWGASGLLVNKERAPGIKNFSDLCDPQYKGRVSMRLKRTILLAMAFSRGEDPFAAYNDKEKYRKIIEKSGEDLIACKPNVKAYWTGGDQLFGLVRSGEVVASTAWDSSMKLNLEFPNINFVAPETGALGWIDTFVLPRKTKAEDAAYKWINFVMRPEIARLISQSTGGKTAAKNYQTLLSPELKKALSEAYSSADVANIKWFPPIPPGLEDIEGKILERVKAAQ